VLIERACRAIEQAETAPSLAALADAVELSPGYFQRLFEVEAAGLAYYGIGRGRSLVVR